jgi:serine/threonine protein kinase
MNEPNNKVPSSPSLVRQPTSTGSYNVVAETLEPTHVPSSPESSGLKIVTIAPGTIPYTDTEVTNSQIARMRADPYLGATIDSRYKVEALLGEGGMGVVYRCVHTIIGKKVAMKVLRADLARDLEVTERFLNEAKAASSIGNAHIIDISDFGQFPDGAAYFVMEYLIGSPLSKLIDGGQSLPVGRILHLARQMAEGLAAAHAAGIVHRDLKPDNIFLVDRGGERDFIKILDFGIAKVSSSSSGAKLTRAGAVFGTPHYMSPEQAAGQPVDHRGDIYSFGVILYELASGRVPFDADNFMGILTQHMYKAPVPIHALVPRAQEIPPSLEAIVLKCLSKRPEHRYQSMAELIAEFDTFSTGGVPAALPEMKARSGGFNVPVDYFRKEQIDARISQSPASHPAAKPRHFRLYAAVVAAIAVIAIGVRIFAGSAPSSATQKSVALPELEHPAAPTASVTPEPKGAPTSDPLSLKQVVLATEPIDAHIFRDGQDLGQSPVAIAIGDNKNVELQIRLEGYKPSTIVLDGTKTRQIVKLEHLARAPVTSHTAAKPKVEPVVTKKPRPAIGGSEIVNPWGN